MLTRREVLAGGVVGSLAADSVDREQPDRQGLKEVEAAISELGTSFDRAFNTLTLSLGPIATLRRNFDVFVRANGRFPEYCEIGLAVFYDVYDWHVRTRQQIIATRQRDNRYTIQFMFTTLVLNHQQDQNFVGYPYDRA
jgi:hypothetical protein